MAHPLRYLIRFFVGSFLVWNMALCAQAASGSKGGLLFTVFKVGESPIWEKLYYLAGPKDAVKLTFLESSRSAPLAVTNVAKPLVFAVEQIDPATNQKNYMPLAEVRWPEGVSTALCVFAVAGGAPPRLQVMMIDDGVKAFPLRTTRVFNATGAPLFGKVAAYSGNLAAGASPSYPYSVASEDPHTVGSYPLAFAAIDGSGKPKLVYSGFGEAWPQGRVMAFVLPPEETGKGIQVRLVVDAPPASNISR